MRIAHRRAIEQIVPFVRQQVQIQNKATAYVCRNYVCDEPVNSIEQFRALLDDSDDK